MSKINGKIKNNKEQFFIDTMKQILDDSLFSLEGLNFVHPLEDKNILDNLSIKTKESDAFTILKKLKRGKFNQFTKDIEKSLKHLRIASNCVYPSGFNPKKYYIPNEYFIDQNFKFLEEEFESIIDTLKDPDEFRNYYYQGDKGSGKTLYQNIYLDRYNDKLEEDDIFWIRCDAQKLYQIWRLSEDFKSHYNVTLKDYIDIQFLYVFAKYVHCNERKLFQKAINEFDENDSFPYIQNRPYEKTEGIYDYNVLLCQDHLDKHSYSTIL